jgi:hypothetical protein
VLPSQNDQDENGSEASDDEFDFESWILSPTNSNSITTEERLQYVRLKHKKDFAGQQLKRLTPQAMSLRHSFGPPYEPGVPVSRVMIRGEYDNPGEVVLGWVSRVVLQGIRSLQRSVWTPSNAGQLEVGG